MKIAIIGSRIFDDYEYLKSSILSEMRVEEITHIVSGGARGTDTLAEIFADEFGIDKVIFKPEWDRYGKAAGMIRNSFIVDEADVVFAFWNGKSKGTNDSIMKAKKRNKKVYIVDI